MSYDFLLDLALILLCTKVFGLLTRSFKLPQVVGALLAGVILGPAVLNILQDADFITKVSEVGVIVLMFTAGMETDIRELKKTGKAFFSLPFAVCWSLWPAASFWRTSSMIPVCPRVQPQACSFRTCLSASFSQLLPSALQWRP